MSPPTRAEIGISATSVGARSILGMKSRLTIGGAGDVANLSPFWERTARK